MLTAVDNGRLQKLSDINHELGRVLSQIDYAENFRILDPDPNLADYYQRKDWLLARKRELGSVCSTILSVT